MEQTMNEKLNIVRAGVLGANDGILTVVGVLFSVAATTQHQFTILIAGLADLIACALAMASGEYASVSSQYDTEKAAVNQATQQLKNDYQNCFARVKQFYQNKGVTGDTASEIATELLTHKPLETLVAIDYDIALGHYTSPLAAAVSSFFSAGIGGVFPLLALFLAPVQYQFAAAILATTVAVALTGLLSAQLGHGLTRKAILRNVFIGLLTITIHWVIGLLM